MPYFSVDVNKPIEEEACREISQKATDLLSELLGKPQKVIMVAIKPAAKLIMNGNTEPVAFLELKAIGFPEERAAELVTALTVFTVKEFGVSPDRQFIQFTNLNGAMFGFNGATLAPK